MEPPDAVAFRDRAVVVDDVLVVADLHVGRGAAGGFELPVGDGADLLDRFGDLLETTDVATAVVAGDLLHSFRTIPRTVEETLAGLRDRARSAGTELVVTPGNHDTMLDAVWDGRTTAAYRTGETVICHGHEPPTADAELYVVGHDHPTLAVEGRRRPCALVGRGVYDGADVVMLPAFNRLLRGVKVNRMRAADFQSPLVTDADAFAPVAWDDARAEPVVFPTLGEFRHRLR